MGTSPAIHLWTMGYRNVVATTLPLEVFTQRNFVSDFSTYRLSWILLAKTAKSYHPLGDLGVTYTVHLARWTARDRLHITANWTYFASSHGWIAMSGYWSKLWCSKGGGHFERKFQGERRSSTNKSWRQKTRVPGLSRGVVCVILLLAVLIQYRHMTHRHEDGQCPRRVGAARVKIETVLDYTLQVTLGNRGNKTRITCTHNHIFWSKNFSPIQEARVGPTTSGVNLAGILVQRKGRSRQHGGGTGWDVGRCTPPHRGKDLERGPSPSSEKNTRWLYCVEWRKYSIRLEGYLCTAQDVYFLHSRKFAG